MELYSTHKEGLKKAQGWQKKLEALNARIFAPMGLAVEAGNTSVELSLPWLLKIKQDLKVSAKLRAQFREYGETNQSVLQDFLESLVLFLRRTTSLRSWMGRRCSRWSLWGMWRGRWMR